MNSPSSVFRVFVAFVASVDPARYTLGGKRVTMLITSRGCPYHCTFCSIFLTAGRQFRTRSLSGIINEMRLCREDFGTAIFDIEDDNFSFDQPRAVAILNLKSKRDQRRWSSQQRSQGGAHEK